ncbi:hypothetical protein [Nocardioides sp. 1609]|uniref:hypothetical protein n=1 Tax=Nocardioides sp. 1609 TaxID=2508327 RepID=UPI00106FCF18|nr:hypothetical protein [Nocardioides sp. 1609]
MHPHAAPPYAVPHTRPPRRQGDLSVSVAALAVAAGIGFLLGAFGLMSLAFVDGCTPPDCDADAFTRAINLTLVGASVVGIGGTVTTVVRLARRSVAWPFAVATLVLVLATYAVGGVFWYRS